MGSETRLRPMTKRDLDWVLKCRNHRSIRAISTSSKVISKTDHLRWFKESVARKFIFEYKGKRAGVVIIEPDLGCHEWSFYLDPNIERGRGLGSVMCALALYWCFERKIKTLVGVVLKTNQISIKLHEKFGFKLAREIRDGRKTIYEYQLELPTNR